MGSNPFLRAGFSTFAVDRAEKENLLAHCPRAASTRCNALSRDRWLRVHREQLYSVYLAALQACARDQRRCAHLRGQSRNLDGVVEEHGERYEFFKADIASADQMDALMTEHQFYAVINFAAESHVDRSINSPLNFIHTNVVGASVLLDCARRHGVSAFHPDLDG
jgi:hypothetical protein